MTNTFFAEQLEDEREAWKADHDAAMECRDLEKLLRRGTGIFHLIRLTDESWSRKVQEGGETLKAEHVRTLSEAYDWWLLPCDAVLTSVEKMERSFEVDGSDEFRRCYRLAKNLATISAQSLIDSFAEAAGGQASELTAEDWGGLQDPKNA